MFEFPMKNCLKKGELEEELKEESQLAADLDWKEWELMDLKWVEVELELVVLVKEEEVKYYFEELLLYCLAQGC